MDKLKFLNKATRQIIAVVIPVLLAGSCAAPELEKKDPFFDKWKTRSETSKGYSPAEPKPLSEQPQVIKPKELPREAISEVKQKPLPTRSISLKMTNIDVAVVLRALARASDLNIIVSERVAGKININIAQAPWDQVFIGILRTQGLSYAWEGDIIRIMTAADMEDDIKRQARQRELTLAEAPLTRIVPVRFSSAQKLKDNLEKFLSADRDGKAIGSILVDEHTNALIIQAIRSDMASIISVIEQLDQATPQVLIEAFIVEANKDVARELGVQWGGVARTGALGTGTGFASGRGNQSLGGGVNTAVNPSSGTVVDLPAQALSGFEPFSLGLVYQNIGDVLLSAQLTALQDQGKLNILSSPSITTLDNQTASIESGEEIPFQSVEDGEVNVQFKKAVLRLQVTPHVIDDKTLKMYINVHKDEADFSRTVLGNPTILTKNAETNVIQLNGQTIVIGGLNKETTTRSDTGVPYLQDIPGLGYLFKRKGSEDRLEDLLIFITPRILQPPSEG